MKKENCKSKKTIKYCDIFLSLFCIIFIAMISAGVYSTGQHIGYFSAMQLSMCASYIPDAQCIGEVKAKIIADLHNDGRDTHGIQIYYDNQVDINDSNRHLLNRHLLQDNYIHKR